MTPVSPGQLLGRGRRHYAYAATNATAGLHLQPPARSFWLLFGLFLTLFDPFWTLFLCCGRSNAGSPARSPAQPPDYIDGNHLEATGQTFSGPGSPASPMGVNADNEWWK